MLRTARLNLFVAACTTALALTILSTPSLAQDASLPGLQPREVAGAPFSAVGTMQIIRRTLDGNRFVRTNTTRYYRDGQGRLRIEREFQPATLALRGTPSNPFEMVTVMDRIGDQLYFLRPADKTVNVMKGAAASGAVDCDDSTNGAPPLTAVFDGAFISPSDPGWSAPASLGERSIDGINAVGIRRAYTIAAGALQNEKPVSITIEQWFSPTLKAVLLKTVKSSTGGETTYKLERIVQAEPDAALFTIPADYRQVTQPESKVGTVTATVVSSGSGN
jgi:hypothetical protein